MPDANRGEEHLQFISFKISTVLYGTKRRCNNLERAYFFFLVVGPLNFTLLFALIVQAFIERPKPNSKCLPTQTHTLHTAPRF